VCVVHVLREREKKAENMAKLTLRVRVKENTPHRSHHTRYHTHGGSESYVNNLICTVVRRKQVFPAHSRAEQSYC